MGWTTIISFLFKNWKYFAILLVGVFVGSYITAKIHSIKYYSLQNQYNGCVTSLNSCLSANEENIKTIDSLKREVISINKSCENRVNNYKKLLSRLQNIDNLSGGKDEKGTADCPDDICVNLNSLWK